MGHVFSLCSKNPINYQGLFGKKKEKISSTTHLLTPLYYPYRASTLLIDISNNIDISGSIMYDSNAPYLITSIQSPLNYSNV
jgi:hypothetical protein